MEKLQRNSSIELMRLVLMLMIVVHHGIVHGLGLSSLGWGENAAHQFSENFTNGGGNILPIILMNSLCICAVNCFVLISGYYGIKPTPKKALVLLSAVLFYTLLFTTSYYIANKEYTSGLYSLLILSHSKYWFVVDYLFLMAFAPLFNKFHGRKLIIIMLFISCYMGFVWKFQANVNGYTLFQFFTMYCLGRYFKEHKVNIGKWTGLSLYFGGAVITAALCFAFFEMDEDKLAWRMTYYNNPLIVISAIGLFFFFSNIKFESRKVNLLAKSAFGIYLLQCSEGIGNFYYDTVHEISFGNDISFTMMSIFLLASGIMIMAVAIDFIQRFISGKIISNLEITDKQQA